MSQIVTSHLYHGYEIVFQDEQWAVLWPADRYVMYRCRRAADAIKFIEKTLEEGKKHADLSI
jgi:hypothetical protein